MPNFLGQFLREPRNIGAVAPSMPALSRALADALDLDDAETVIEYGPGTGVVTEEVLATRTPGTRLIAIERNPDFCRQLRKRFAGVEDFELIEGSAADVADIVAGLGVTRVDRILSGLPLSSLPDALGEEIMTASARLIGTHGLFVLFQYSRYRRAMMQRHFAHVTSRRVIANLPPAWVFTCDNRGGV